MSPTKAGLSARFLVHFPRRVPVAGGVAVLFLAGLVVAWSNPESIPSGGESVSVLRAADPVPKPKRGTKSSGAKSGPADAKSERASEDKSDPTVPEDQAQLLTLDQAERDLPSLTRLLEGPAIDWIVLHTNRIIRVEAVTPRPDAESNLNTLEKMNATIRKSAQALPLPQKTDESRSAFETASAKHALLYYLPVHLAEEEIAREKEKEKERLEKEKAKLEREKEREKEKNPDKQIEVESDEDLEPGFEIDLSMLKFKIHTKHIKQIIYYEDLMLWRVDRLLDEQKTVDAFELMAALRERAPKWTGIEDRQDRLLFTEGTVRLRLHAPEEALIYFEALQKRNPRYEGLRKQLGTIFTELIAGAAKREDYRAARHFLERMRKILPTHRSVTEFSDEFQALATQRLQNAIEAAEQGRHDVAVDIAESVTRIWPNLPNLPEQYRRLSNRFPRLHVGVLQLPDDELNQMVPSAANLRPAQAGPPPLFEPARLDGTVVRYQSRFFEDWEPTDLGRNITFRVKRRRAPWESCSQLTAGRIVAALADRMDPRHVNFDERFSAAVSTVTFLSPFEFEVDFSRVPLRPEVLFAFPIRAGEPSAEVASASAEVAADAIAVSEIASDQPLFVRVSQTEDRVAYRRSIPEPGDSARFHVAEIVEHKYPTHEKALQALMRGEVAVLPSIPLWEVSNLQKLKNLFVHSYGLPVTHVLQFHPRNVALANRTLRRAMVFAIDRQGILDKTFLNGAPVEYLAPKEDPKGTPPLGRLTSSPIPTGSAGYDALIQPHKHDVTLAMTMLIAAKKELGEEIPPLRLCCPNDPVIMTAANQLIQQWDQIGLKVKLAGSTDKLLLNSVDDQPQWDIMYRTVSMAAPHVEMWPFLTLDPKARVESLGHLPSWLRQELVALEGAGDWSTTERILHSLHRQLWAEVALIPLWEVADFIVIRNTAVRDAPTRPMCTYQGIERWIVQPWYPKENP